MLNIWNKASIREEKGRQLFLKKKTSTREEYERFVCSKGIKKCQANELIREAKGIVR